MQHLEVSGAVRPIYASLGVKGLRKLSVLQKTVSSTDLTSSGNTAC